MWEEHLTVYNLAQLYMLWVAEWINENHLLLSDLTPLIASLHSMDDSLLPPLLPTAVSQC